MPVPVTFFGDEGMITVDDRTGGKDSALEEAKQTHFERGFKYAPYGWTLCDVCLVNWPCLTARLVAEHEALQARAAR